MRRFAVLFFLLLSGLISSVHAQGTSVISQTFLQSYGEGDTAYLIATLPASSNSTYDHLHLVATLDCSYYSACDSTLDMTLGNRSGFNVVYTAMGGNPVGLTTHIVAYQQGAAGSAVNVYIVLPNNWVTATYAILENIEETVPSSPTAINIDSNPLAGTLIFDTNSASYPPQNYTDFTGDFYPSGKVGIGTSNALAPLSVGSSSQFQVSSVGAVSAPSLSLTTALPVASGGTGAATLTGLVKGNGTSAFTAAVAGTDYQKPISLTTTGTGAATFSGNALNIPQSASYTFSTGLTNSSGTITSNLSTGITGGQTAYGGIGATDVLTLQGTKGNGTLTLPAINLAVGNAGATTALTVLNNGNLGIGTTSPGSKLEVNGSIKMDSGVLTFPDGSTQTSAYTTTDSSLNQAISTSSGNILASGNLVPGGYGVTRSVVPLAMWGPEAFVNSTSWQALTRTNYTSIAGLFSGTPVLPGATRKYYLVIRRADNQPGGNGSNWRFSCPATWNGGTYGAGHGFTLQSNWGSLDEGGTDWVEIPPGAISSSSCTTGYWELDAEMSNAATAMRVMNLSMAAVDINGGTNIVYSQAAAGTPSNAVADTLFDSLWSNGNGNVGIGTTSPAHTLDVNGQVNASGGYCLSGNCITSWPTSGANSWTGAQTFGSSVNFAGTGVWNPSGSVGIGTTTPIAPLSVVGPNNPTLTLTAQGVTAVAGNHGATIDFHLDQGASGGASGNALLGRIESDPQDGWGGHLVFSTKPADGNPASSLVERMRILYNGNVGIGTTTPQAMLDVDGSVRISGSGANLTFPDGTIQSTAYSGTCTATGGDYAESVAVIGEKSGYEPGDVMVLASDTKFDVTKSSEPYSTMVAGIYSTKPGYVGRRQQGNPKLSNTEIPMAMVGIVPTKVSAENGPIHRGDLLVTASKPGYAMKGTDRNLMMGAVVGKAMGSLDAGTGVIEVLVSLQ